MRRIAIIGFGFSGCMLLANLVRAAKTSLEIYVIDPTLNPRGVAYSTPYAQHLLNVRAANMGAWEHDVGDFQRWLEAQDLPYAPTDFVPRQIYGDYLEAVFKHTQEEAARKRIFIKLVPTQAVALRQDAGHLAVLTERGDAIAVDQAVLATGNEFKPVAAPVDVPVLQNPWEPGALRQAAGQGGPILLVGTGLTAVDVVLALRAEHYTGALAMYSRNGLLPQPHREAVLNPALDAAQIAPLHTLQQWMRWMRAATRTAADWRSVVDGLRPFTQSSWQKLALPAQKIFLRRVLSFWNVHRHRMAPQIAAQIAAEETAGTLRRVMRRSGGLAGLGVAYAINCTGPELDVARSRSPLLKQLLAGGMVERHATGLGIGTDARQRAWGALHPNLYAMGALLTGQLLESTAVPELRAQAASIAESLCS